MLKSATKELEAGHGLLTPQSALSTRVDLLVGLANLRRYEGAVDEAYRLLHDGLSYAHGAEMAYLRFAIALTRHHDKDYAEATDAALLALSASRRFENRVVTPYVLCVLSKCHLHHGLLDQAESCLGEGLEAALDNQDPRVQCQLLATRAEIALRRGQTVFAQELMENVRDLIKLHSYPLWHLDFSRTTLEQLETLPE